MTNCFVGNGISTSILVVGLLVTFGALGVGGPCTGDQMKVEQAKGLNSSQVVRFTSTQQ